MAKSPVQSAVTKWSQISSQMKALGVDTSHYASLMKDDVTNVSLGKTGLTSKEITDGIIASIQGKANVNPQSDKGGGFLDTIGNTFSDIGSAAFNFVPGIINLATQASPISFHEGLSNPIQVPHFLEQIGGIISHDPKTIAETGIELPDSGDNPLNIAGKFVRDISRVPLLGQLIPGAHTAGALTSAKGREEIKQHPGFAALDVLPYASEAGKLATAGKEAEQFSATEAFQQGNVVKGTLRGTYDLLSDKTPIPLPTREAMRNIVERSTLSQGAKDLVLRPMSVASNSLQHKWGEFMQQDWMQKMIKLSPERRAAMTYAKTHGDLSPLSTEERSLVRATTEVDNVVAASGIEDGSLRVIPPPPGAQGTEGFTYAATSSVGKAYDLMNKLGEKAAAAKANLEDVIRAGGDQSKAEAKLSVAQDKFESASKKFDKTYRSNAPAIYHPVMEEYVRNRVHATFQSSEQALAMSAKELDAATATIFSSPYSAELKSLVGKTEFNAIMKDAKSLWLDADRLAAAGVTSRPLYVHNTPLNDNEFLRPSISRGLKETKPKSYLHKSFNLGNSGQDIVIGVQKNFADHLSRIGNEQFVRDHVMPQLKTAADLHDTYMEMARNIQLGGKHFGYKVEQVHGQTTASLAEQLMRNDYVEYNGSVHGFDRYIPKSPDTQLLPKGIAKSLALMKSDVTSDIPFIGRYSRANRVFRFAVLTGPRHMAHVGLGGLVMGTAYEPGFLTHMGTALKVMKEEFWPEVMGQHINEVDAGNVLDFAAGKTRGRLAGAVMGLPQAMNRAEETITTMYKVAATLSAESRGLSHAEALDLANKMFVDVSNMSAFESVWVRSLAPFYAFTKHLLRYMSSFATDHPIRASILSNLANIQQQHFGNALPGTYQTLFFFGSPDAQGNNLAIDYRSLNPFRSMYSVFSLSGMLSSLNPAFQATLQTAGVNTLSATPELYPTLHVDPQTGQLVATHDPKSVASNFLGAYVPETRAIDALVGLSDNYKYLRQTNPDAFARLVMSSLNIPFIPSSYNLTKEAQTLEIKRYKQAQKDVSSALSSNDFSTISHYNQVPAPAWLASITHSQYVTPTELERIWGMLRSKSGNVDPRATMRRKR